MPGHRFFISADTGIDLNKGKRVSLALDSQTFHHAVRVLRLKVGEHIEVVLRDVWSTYQCEVEDITIDSIEINVIAEVPTTELPAQIDLIWGYAKGDKNERIVRQATEIGCTGLIPVRFSRCDVRLDEERFEKKRQRLQSIAESAAMQAHRSVIPAVESVLSFKSLLQMLENYGAIIVAWEQVEEPSISSLADACLQSGASRIALIIGPEGGIECSEIDALRGIGAQVASMGDSILRVETACTVGCAILADRIRTHATLSAKE